MTNFAGNPSGRKRFTVPYAVAERPGGLSNIDQQLSNLKQAGAQQDWEDQQEVELRRQRVEDRGFEDSRRRFDLGREDTNRQFDLGREDTNRQFDAKTNMFREMLARKMPDFFGAGASPTMGGIEGSFGRVSANGGGQAFGGFQDPGLDAATRNYLLRFLR